MSASTRPEPKASRSRSRSLRRWPAPVMICRYDWQHGNADRLDWKFSLRSGTMPDEFQQQSSNPYVSVNAFSSAPRLPWESSFTPFFASETFSAIIAPRCCEKIHDEK
ncbi:uncharacterized protein LOC144608247 [Rhinoraja longicauda]